jgi:hypothetical protein
LLWRLYEGDAHIALGHASWHAYCKSEFGFSKSQSYRLRDAGRVAEVLPQLGNEAAREFVRLLYDHRDELEEVWREAARRAEASNRLTASQIRGVVDEVLDSARQPSVQAADLISPSPSARCARRLVELADELAGKLLDLEDSATRFDMVTSEGELGDAWSAHTGLLSLVRTLASEGRSLLDEAVSDAQEIGRRSHQSAKAAGARVAKKSKALEAPGAEEMP